MRIAEVVGNVTLNRCHPAFRGANLKLVIPLLAKDLVRRTADVGHAGGLGRTRCRGTARSSP